MAGCDIKLVADVVDRLKKQGLFDQFRKDCLADVDTTPAYQNLTHRVQANVDRFLLSQKWRPDLNKNQLRESVRRYLTDSAMLTAGIDRVVDQVINPNVIKDFKPKVDKVICECLGLDYGSWLEKQNKRNLKRSHAFASSSTAPGLGFIPGTNNQSFDGAPPPVIGLSRMTNNPLVIPTGLPAPSTCPAPSLGGGLHPPGASLQGPHVPVLPSMNVPPPNLCDAPPMGASLITGHPLDPTTGGQMTGGLGPFSGMPGQFNHQHGPIDYGRLPAPFNNYEVQSTSAEFYAHNITGQFPHSGGPRMRFPLPGLPGVGVYLSPSGTLLPGVHRMDGPPMTRHPGICSPVESTLMGGRGKKIHGIDAASFSDTVDKSGYLPLRTSQSFGGGRKTKYFKDSNNMEYGVIDDCDDVDNKNEVVEEELYTGVVDAADERFHQDAAVVGDAKIIPDRTDVFDSYTGESANSLCAPDLSFYQQTEGGEEGGYEYVGPENDVTGLENNDNDGENRAKEGEDVDREGEKVEVGEIEMKQKNAEMEEAPPTRYDELTDHLTHRFTDQLADQLTDELTPRFTDNLIDVVVDMSAGGGCAEENEDDVVHPSDELAQSIEIANWDCDELGDLDALGTETM